MPLRDVAVDGVLLVGTVDLEDTDASPDFVVDHGVTLASPTARPAKRGCHRCAGSARLESAAPWLLPPQATPTSAARSARPTRSTACSSPRTELDACECRACGAGMGRGAIGSIAAGRHARVALEPPLMAARVPIFDLDGTLLDTDEALVATFVALGVPRDEITFGHVLADECRATRDRRRHLHRPLRHRGRTAVSGRAGRSSTVLDRWALCSNKHPSSGQRGAGPTGLVSRRRVVQ